jgi:hypothetical protein
MNKLTKAIVDFVIRSVKESRAKLIDGDLSDNEMQFVMGKIAAYDEVLELIKAIKEGD